MLICPVPSLLKEIVKDFEMAEKSNNVLFDKNNSVPRNFLHKST